MITSIATTSSLLACPWPCGCGVEPAVTGKARADAVALLRVHAPEVLAAGGAVITMVWYGHEWRKLPVSVSPA